MKKEPYDIPLILVGLIASCTVSILEINELIKLLDNL